MKREHLSSPTPPTLAGSLLLAHPSLREDTFRHTVILVSAHDEKGAMGIILNRPFGKRLGEIDSDFALGPLSEVPAYQGGPVHPKQLLLCAWRFHPEGLGFQLMLGINPEKASALQVENGMHLRAFFGYAGWTAGQLDNELKHDTWVVTPLLPGLIDTTHDETLWRTLLSGLGHPWKLLASEPDDPTRN